MAAHDHVAVGQRLGLVGNSGNTTMPHIHMHIQDAPQAGHGHGRLFTYVGVTGTIAGTPLMEKDVPLLAGTWLER